MDARKATLRAKEALALAGPALNRPGRHAGVPQESLPCRARGRCSAAGRCRPLVVPGGGGILACGENTNAKPGGTLPAMGDPLRTEEEDVGRGPCARCGTVGLSLRRAIWLL